MSIGDRIKAARHMAGLSQRDLAQQVGLSAMAISKYENEQDVPSSGVLLRLSRALSVRVEYLLRPITVSLTAPAYRRRVSLPQREQGAIIGRIQEWIERYLDAEAIVSEEPRFGVPANLNRQVASPEEIEQVSLDLRDAWRLGHDPIDNLVEVLESQGIKIGIVDATKDFDALTLWLNEREPVIAIKADLPGDRQRFNLAHELGHLILQPSDDMDLEKCASRFAGSFLAPEPAARRELGNHRRMLNMYELHLLKHKYGLSMQAWIYRARDLGILTEWASSDLFRQFRQHGWHKVEPGDPIPTEQPARLKRLVMRALAEGLISESRAAELLGKPLAKFYKDEAEQHAGFPVGLCG